MNIEYYAVVLQPNTPYQAFNDVAKCKALLTVEVDETLYGDSEVVYDLALLGAQKIYGLTALSMSLRTVDMDDFESTLDSADYHIEVKASQSYTNPPIDVDLKVHSKWNGGKGILVRGYPHNQKPAKNSHPYTLVELCQLNEHNVRTHSFVKVRES